MVEPFSMVVYYSTVQVCRACLLQLLDLLFPWQLIQFEGGKSWIWGSPRKKITGCKVRRGWWPPNITTQLHKKRTCAGNIALTNASDRQCCLGCSDILFEPHILKVIKCTVCLFLAIESHRTCTIAVYSNTHHCGFCVNAIVKFTGVYDNHFWKRRP